MKDTEVFIAAQKISELFEKYVEKRAFLDPKTGKKVPFALLPDKEHRKVGKKIHAILKKRYPKLFKDLRG